MSLNKPRPDYPIYPSTGYFRERAKAFKRPKGRGGRKPKGQRVGRFVSFQDPNFLIIKAQDEARKARELAVAQAQAAAEDREERRDIARQQLQLAQGSARLQAAEAQARQREAQARSDEARERDRRERMRDQRLIEDRREITGHLTRLYESSERRAGENLAVMRDAFQAITDRRPVDFRDVGEQEQTDLTADQRRESRSRSPSADTLGRQVSVGFESVEGTPKPRQRTPSPERERQVGQVKQQLQPEPEPETKQNVPIETIEQTTRKGRDVKLPKRFEGGATEAEIEQAGGIEGQTPAAQRYKQQPKPKTTARGGAGTDEVQRQRPKLKAGQVIKAGKQGGRAPLAKKAQTPKTQQGTIGLDLFGSSPAGQAFAEEVKKSEEALRAAAERAKPKLELKLSSEEEIAQQLGQTKKKGGGRK